MRPYRRWSLLLIAGVVVASCAIADAATRLFGSHPPIGEHGYLGLLLHLGIPFTLAVAACAELTGTGTGVAPIGLGTFVLAPPQDWDNRNEPDDESARRWLVG